MLVSGQFNLLSSGTSELIDQLLAHAILERMRWTLRPITVPEELRVAAVAVRNTSEIRSAEIKNRI